MIRKAKEEFVAECDECGTEYFGGTIEDWHEFLGNLKDAGWKVRRKSDEWQHVCEECLRDSDD